MPEETDPGLRRQGGPSWWWWRSWIPSSRTTAVSWAWTVSGKEALPLEGEFSQNLVAAKLGGAVHTGTALEDAIPAPPAGDVRRLSPPRTVLHPGNKNKCTVLGDIGCYTLGAVAPLTAMDMTLCMGASISGIHGFNKALGEESEGKTVAVIGDSTFMHSGMTGLANIAYNQSNSTVIILDNSITGMTGHQQNPTTGYNIKGDPAGKIDLEHLCRAMGFDRVRVVDPYDLKATRPGGEGGAGRPASPPSSSAAGPAPC